MPIPALPPLFFPGPRSYHPLISRQPSLFLSINCLPFSTLGETSNNLFFLRVSPLHMQVKIQPVFHRFLVRFWMISQLWACSFTLFVTSDEGIFGPPFFGRFFAERLLTLRCRFPLDFRVCSFLIPLPRWSKFNGPLFFSTLFSATEIAHLAVSRIFLFLPRSPLLLATCLDPDLFLIVFPPFR